jgi:hypothetical protein
MNINKLQVIGIDLVTLPYLLSFPPGRGRRLAGRSNNDNKNHLAQRIEKHHKTIRIQNIQQQLKIFSSMKLIFQERRELKSVS